LTLDDAWAGYNNEVVNPWVICIFLAAGLAMGCKRQDSASAPAAATAEKSADPAPPASPRGPGPAPEALTNASVIADTGDINATLQQLTGALRDYVVRTRSIPKNFDEFAAKSQVSFPAPPPGKKYAIEKQAVVLVKR
jgi:hypothetical protein